MKDIVLFYTIISIPIFIIIIRIFLYINEIYNLNKDVKLHYNSIINETNKINFNNSIERENFLIELLQRLHESSYNDDYGFDYDYLYNAKLFKMIVEKIFDIDENKNNFYIYFLCFGSKFGMPFNYLEKIYDKNFKSSFPIKKSDKLKNIAMNQIKICILKRLEFLKNN